MKKTKKMPQLIMAILLFTAGLAGCQKYDDSDFTPREDSGKDVAIKSSAAQSGDTVYSLPNFVIKFWLENLPVLPQGYDYSYSWNPGDGSSILTTARIEHQYALGTYQLVATATNPLSGVVITRTLWIKIASGNYADSVIVVISATPVSGGFDYLLGFASHTIANFQDPPYGTNIPFVTGTFCSWQINPPPAAPDYQTINGETYITKHLVFANNVAQDLQFGQGTNWSYGPNSTYWVWTGTGTGKYVVYPYNGQLFTGPQGGTVYCPGEDGDPEGSTATVRDSLILGATSATDSLRLFINYQLYANGSAPFISFIHLGSWSNVALKIISGTGWGYYTFAVADIASDNNKLYFKFGPELSTPSVFGNMEQSKFYNPDTGMCGIQLTNTKSGKRLSPI